MGGPATDLSGLGVEGGAGFFDLLDGLFESVEGGADCFESVAAERGDNLAVSGEVAVGAGAGEEGQDAGTVSGAAAELDEDAALVGVDFLDVEGVGAKAGLHDGEGVLDGSGHGAVPVGHFGADFVEELEGAGAHDALIEVEALAFVVDVVGGDEDVAGEIQSGEGFEATEGIVLGRDVVTVGKGFEELDFGFDELGVQLVTDGDHLAGLLGAEEVAGAANLEVAEGEGVTAAEVSEFLEGIKTRHRVFGEGFVAVEEAVGVGLAVAATDATAKLIELAEAEVFDVVDNDGVGVGDVESVFDDRGRDEDVDFAANEAEHDGFELAFGHLAVADGDAGAGDETADAIGDEINAVHAVCDVIGLAATGELAEEGFADDFIAVGSNGRADGQAAGGWVVDERHGPDVHEGDAEGAGDGGCAHGEHVDVDAQFLEGFFVFDAELLFFVNDEEAELFEAEFLAEEGVGADDDLDGSVFETFFDLGSFGG